jgi:GxxExxY protein
MHEEKRSELERLASIIVDSGLKVHRALGPGLLESAYEHCLAYELESRGLRVDRQMPLPIVYDGVRLDAGYRLDLLVEKSIIIEVKVVEALTPVHYAQLLTYLKLSGCRIGFLMNFHVALFKQGLKRLVL